MDDNSTKFIDNKIGEVCMGASFIRIHILSANINIAQFSSAWLPHMHCHLSSPCMAESISYNIIMCNNNIMN